MSRDLTPWQLIQSLANQKGDFARQNMSRKSDPIFEGVQNFTLWKESYDQPSLDSILKSRDITLPTNICLVKAMVFPVVMYGCVPVHHQLPEFTQTHVH